MKTSHEEMNQKYAASVLEIHGEITPRLIKESYRRLALKFHPDRGGSTEMMQQLNAAYVFFKNLILTNIKKDCEKNKYENFFNEFDEYVDKKYKDAFSKSKPKNSNKNNEDGFNETYISPENPHGIDYCYFNESVRDEDHFINQYISRYMYQPHKGWK